MECHRSVPGVFGRYVTRNGDPLMSYDLHQIEFAMCWVRILALIGAVALVSYATRSRAVFVVGAIGSLLGFAVPEPVVYAQYSSAEAAALNWLDGVAKHVLFYGMLGATAGCATGLLAGRLLARRRKRRTENANVM